MCICSDQAPGSVAASPTQVTKQAQKQRLRTVEGNCRGLIILLVPSDEYGFWHTDFPTPLVKCSTTILFNQRDINSRSTFQLCSYCSSPESFCGHHAGDPGHGSLSSCIGCPVKRNCLNKIRDFNYGYAKRLRIFLGVYNGQFRELLPGNRWDWVSSEIPHLGKASLPPPREVFKNLNADSSAVTLVSGWRGTARSASLALSAHWLKAAAQLKLPLKIGKNIKKQDLKSFFEQCSHKFSREVLLM